MRYYKLKQAIDESRRFIAKAERLKKLCEDTNEINPEELCKFEFSFCVPGKQAAAVKRASMDLTRALAELRDYRD